MNAEIVFGNYTNSTSSIADTASQREIKSVLLSFFGGLSVPGQIASFFTYTSAIMLAQVGGIPRPSKNSQFTTLLWYDWLALQGAQVFLLFLSLIAFCSAFTGFQHKYYNCMIPSAGTNTPSLNVLAAMTFPLQPVFLSKLMLMTMNWAILVEGIKLFYATKRDENPAFDTDSVNLNLDKHLVVGFAILTFIPLLVWTLFCWVLSLSFVFTFFFLVILIVFILFAICIYVLCLRFIFKKNNEWMDSHKDEMQKYLMTLKNKNTQSSGENKIPLAHSLVLKAHELVKETLWWVKATTDPFFPETENGNQSPTDPDTNPFVVGIQFSCIVFIVSPIIVFGTWLAIACYNGADFTRSLGLIFDISFYEFRFGFHAPPINFSDIALLADFQALGAAYLNGVYLPPEQNIKAARSLYGLSQLMSIIKAFISISTDVLGKAENLVPHARFHEEAQISMRIRLLEKESEFFERTGHNRVVD